MFLGCPLQVRVFELSTPGQTPHDCLVLGSDGLWDVLSNADVRADAADAAAVPGAAAQDLASRLVARARGERKKPEVDAYMRKLFA